MNISRLCAEGKHHRCLGTVMTLPADQSGDRIVPCECPSEACAHAKTADA